MTPSFTRAEYWLLEAALKECLPIGNLRYGYADQKFAHGVTHAELVDALERLFAEDLIIGERYESFWTKTRPKVKLTRPEIEVELSRPMVSEDGVADGFGPLGVYYWLTSKGGSAWEAFAQPSWDDYMEGFATISYIGDMEGPGFGRAICPSKEKLERYVAGVHWFGWEIDHEAIRWDIIRPWRALYWKRLPLGNRVRFPILKRVPKHPYDAPHSYWELDRWYRWRR